MNSHSAAMAAAGRNESEIELIRGLLLLSHDDEAATVKELLSSSQDGVGLDSSVRLRLRLFHLQLQLLSKVIQ